MRFINALRLKYLCMGLSDCTLLCAHTPIAHCREVTWGCHLPKKGVLRKGENVFYKQSPTVNVGEVLVPSQWKRKLHDLGIRKSANLISSVDFLSSFFLALSRPMLLPRWV